MSQFVLFLVSTTFSRFRKLSCPKSKANGHVIPGHVAKTFKIELKVVKRAKTLTN